MQAFFRVFPLEKAKHRTSLGKTSDVSMQKFRCLCPGSPMFSLFRKPILDVFSVFFAEIAAVCTVFFAFFSLVQCHPPPDWSFSAVFSTYTEYEVRPDFVSRI